MTGNHPPGILKASANFTLAFKKLHKAKCAMTDFDRTLLQLFDSETANRVTEALRDLYRAFGVDTGDRESHQDPYSLWRYSYSWMLARFPRAEALEIHRQASIALASYEQKAAESASLFPGVVETLKWLQVKKVPCGIVSTNSTEAILRALDANNASELFKAIRGRSDQTPPEELKPSPAPISAMVRELDGTPDTGFFVGDSLDDTVSAHAAGVVAIGVLTGKTSAKSLVGVGADIVIEDFSCLRKLPIAE